jgi:hypothetical protein
MKFVTSLGLMAVVLSAGSVAKAIMYGGIEFPDGAVSFADSVLTYTPLFGGGPGPTHPNATDPMESLGIPDFPGGGGPGDPGAVSLGNGGLLEVLFTDNLLTNSGDAMLDLHVFEVGPDIEDTFVAIRPTAGTVGLLPPAGDANLDGFWEIGKIFGATSSIDIDSFFPGFGAGVLNFDAVQLIDDPAEGLMVGETVGADIDAVGAITSVPEPSTLVLVALGVALLAIGQRRGG